MGDIKLTSGSVIEISRLPGNILQTKGEISDPISKIRCINISCYVHAWSQHDINKRLLAFGCSDGRGGQQVREWTLVQSLRPHVSGRRSLRQGCEGEVWNIPAFALLSKKIHLKVHRLGAEQLLNNESNANVFLFFVYRLGYALNNIIRA